MIDEPERTPLSWGFRNLRPSAWPGWLLRSYWEVREIEEFEADRRAEERAMREAAKEVRARALARGKEQSDRRRAAWRERGWIE